MLHSGPLQNSIHVHTALVSACSGHWRMHFGCCHNRLNSELGCKSVTVYEEQSSLSALRLAHPPALVLEANGARVLDALGVLTAVSAYTAPIHRITQRNTRGDLLSFFSLSQFLHAHTADGSVFNSLISSYSALRSALAVSIPSSSLQWAKEVKTLKRDELGYHTLFASPSAGEVCVDLVVAAQHWAQARTGVALRTAVHWWCAGGGS